MTEHERLMSPAADAKAAAVVAGVVANAEETAAAAMKPMPGPLADAWRERPDKEIVCGKYSVGPIKDGQMHLLDLLDSPVAKKADQALRGEKVTFEEVPRGPHMWNLAWVMTRKNKEALAVWQAQGLDGIRKQAMIEFSELALPQLMSLFEAVIEQIPAYWSTAIGYGPEAKEGETASRPTNPS